MEFYKVNDQTKHSTSRRTVPLHNGMSQAPAKKLQNYFSIHLIDFPLILVDDIERRSFRHSLQYSDPYITPKRKSQTQS
jgi:hypothetical protein